MFTYLLSFRSVHGARDCNSVRTSRSYSNSGGGVPVQVGLLSSTYPSMINGCCMNIASCNFISVHVTSLDF